MLKTSDKNYYLLCSAAGDMSRGCREHINNKIVTLIEEGNLSEEDISLVIHTSIIHTLSSIISQSIIENELQSQEFAEMFKINLLEYFKRLREYGFN